MVYDPQKPMTVDHRDRLIALAEKYETPSFLEGDPSCFMHQVHGSLNQELMAFIASSFSYGSRKQFLPKIALFLQWSEGDVVTWITSGKYRDDIPDDRCCFYRLQCNHDVLLFLSALKDLYEKGGGIRSLFPKRMISGYEALKYITDYFRDKGTNGIIPINTSSPCKRLCMFLRWMVRDSSCVDMGLWSNIIDKRTLIIPLDTHVLQESYNMGLIQTKTVSMKTAITLTETLRTIFPNDPLKGDFALFGLGVDNDN